MFGESLGGNFYFHEFLFNMLGFRLNPAIIRPYSKFVSQSSGYQFSAKIISLIFWTVIPHNSTVVLLSPFKIILFLSFHTAHSWNPRDIDEVWSKIGFS